jgi:hypothetical protein
LNSRSSDGQKPYIEKHITLPKYQLPWQQEKKKKIRRRNGHGLSEGMALLLLLQKQRNF